MAQVDMFLEIDGLKGESKAKGKENLVELKQTVLFVRNEGTAGFGGGAGAGKSFWHDIQVVKKHLDKSSPIIMLRCATGEHMPTAKLYMRKAGGTQQDFYVWELSDVFFSSYHLDTASGDGVLPSDAFTINFSKIKMSYSEQDSKGNIGTPIAAEYDVKAASGKPD